MEAASAAHQLVTVAFDTGDAAGEVFDSCTMSRKYVINNPRSYNCSTTRQNGNVIYRLYYLDYLHFTDSRGFVDHWRSLQI